MITPVRIAAARYAAAVAAVLVVTGARTLADPALGDSATFGPYVIATATVAWTLGRGPGFLSAGLGLLLADWCFLAPRGSLRIADLPGLAAAVAFAIESSAVVIVCHHVRALDRRLEETVGGAKANAARFAATLDALVDPVVYLDSSGLVRLANSAFTHVLGESLIGVAPDAWSARLPADLLAGPAWLQSLHGALTSGGIVRNRRVAFRDASGADRVALASIVPVAHSDTIQGAVLSLHDITQEVTLASALEVASMELRTRFEELLEQQEVHAAQSEEVARQRAQLAERNADLASASRLKSEFLATMSHELRTPLNAVIGFAEVLLADAGQPLPAAHRAYIRDIRLAGEQLLLLINDVLDLTRIEAGRIQIETERMDLVLPLLQARELTSALARDRRVTVVSDLTPGRLFVAADPDRVRQIALNLVSNALKFTAAGGTVTLGIKELPGGTARASVGDTGIGIAPGDLDRLFQPFTQLASGPAGRPGGTGLGLAISRQLVEAMKGTIGCTSVHGRGSTFYFDLPLAGGAIRPEVAEVEPAAHGWGALRGTLPPTVLNLPEIPAPGAAPGPPVTGGDRADRLHVLIVDDNAVNRRVLRSMLASARCDLTEAEDAPTAIQLARDLHPGVILMDIQMPEMDGLAATRILVADPSTADIPVVAITAHGMPGDAERAAAAGCVGYLAKPVGREHLMNAIQRAVGSGAWRA